MVLPRRPYSHDERRKALPKITDLQAVNFRSHERLKIALADFNVFLGLRGAGKSTVLHEISLLLTGVNPVINKKSQGLRDEIRIGADEFHIGLRLDDGTVIEQQVDKKNNSIGVNGEFGKVDVQRGVIKAKLGCSFDLMSCLLDPTPYYRRDEETRRQVLLQFLASRDIPAPDIVQQLKLASKFSSVSEIDKLIKDIKESKIRDLNREIRTLNGVIPPAVEYDPKNKTALEARVRELRAKREEIVRVQTRDEEWRKTLDKLQEELDSLPQPQADAASKQELLSAQEGAARARVTELREQYRAKKLSLDGFNVRKGSTQAEIDRLAGSIETLSSLGKDCPTCKRALGAKEKETILGSLTASKKGVEQALAGLDKDIKKLSAEIEGIAAEGKTKESEIESLSSQRSELASATAKITQAGKALADHQATKPADRNWPKELADVSGDLAAAEIDLEAAKKLEDQVSRRALQVSQVRAKESEAELLDTAAKELAKVKDDILAKSSGGFVASMQSFLQPFGMSKVELSVEDMDFYVDGLSTAQLSGGQKVIVEAALRQAAAKESGFRIMALDDANMLLSDDRQKLSAALMGSGVQVIICSMTDAPPAVPAQLPPNVKMYWFSSPGIHGPTSVRELGSH